MTLRGGPAFFTSDLHGRKDRYRKLLDRILAEKPVAVFLGGDLLPGMGGTGHDSQGGKGFVMDFLEPSFRDLRRSLGVRTPRVFLILGNDDPRAFEADVLAGEAHGTWEYIHERWAEWAPWRVFGYAFVPPSPFRLKDWERYDVSRYVDPGCTHPGEGVVSIPVSDSELNFATISVGLKTATGEGSLKDAICLFHAPPYQTNLDRAALDGRRIDHVPMDVHVGSIAVRRFIESRRPRLTLHGHVHESARLTGCWKENLGNTVMLSAAHDGDELCLVRFDPERPDEATRELI